MSIAQDILTRIQAIKSSLATALTAKGVAVPNGAKLGDFPALVESVETSVIEQLYQTAIDPPQRDFMASVDAPFLFLEIRGDTAYYTATIEIPTEGPFIFFAHDDDGSTFYLSGQKGNRHIAVSFSGEHIITVSLQNGISGKTGISVHYHCPSTESAMVDYVLHGSYILLNN